MRIAGAAVAYWAMVFALGFVLGTIRVLWLAPLVGLIPATALELPVMLAASWIVAGWLMQRFGISGGGGALAMGLIAFALLLALECVLAGVLSGQTPAQWLAGLREPHALLGLGGQVVFAAIPWLRTRRSG
ncbi:hypothetical protein OIK40_12255 [Erythrobacter sp. sf7]|uniref:DUF4149 domain-containing protein n=1 Tax=Erythrobacter fulvus TaxID=2987523 RepID=A0ABT5JTH0_9SPHN|nr:hypothetical protein [Erythrobacter fulvus]MDC8755413.1 hypothetical protein [Erythrobacter fulvus]